MIQFVLLCLYTILPGVVANTLPVFARKIDFLDVPIDMGKTYKNKPIFGTNKTYRGFFFGILGGIIMAYIQRYLYQYETFATISFFNFNETSFLVIGFLMAFGVLGGDLVESFFKRRANVKPGATWFPWDQIDSVVGGLLFISVIKVPTWQMVVFLIIVGPIIHIATNHLGFWLKLKETKW
jgi:CDP-2,3-bis-(O-geranylgeranyl)-sn-glycerol synthase